MADEPVVGHDLAVVLPALQHAVEMVHGDPRSTDPDPIGSPNRSTSFGRAFMLVLLSGSTVQRGRRIADRP